MKSLFSFFLFFSFSSLVYANETPLTPAQDLQFSLVSDQDMEDFEANLAYFFGARNTQEIVDNYILALKTLEEVGANAPDHILRSKLHPHLKKAYEAVSKETGLLFSEDLAADAEMRVILAHARHAPFEEIYEGMKHIYSVVFNSRSQEISKASLLRTFIYLYKVDVVKKEKSLSEMDKKLLLSLAYASEVYLQVEEERAYSSN